jgi:hypothetical protein
MSSTASSKADSTKSSSVSFSRAGRAGNPALNCGDPHSDFEAAVLALG